VFLRGLRESLSGLGRVGVLRWFVVWGRWRVMIVVLRFVGEHNRKVMLMLVENGDLVKQEAEQKSKPLDDE
jgi:hypothetical protein